MSFIFFLLFLIVVNSDYSKTYQNDISTIINNIYNIDASNNYTYIRYLANKDNEAIISILNILNVSKCGDVVNLFYQVLGEYPELIIKEIQKYVFKDEVNETEKYLREIINITNPIINMTLDILCNLNNSVLNNLIQLLGEENVKFYYVIEKLKHIFQVPEVEQLFNEFLDKYGEFFMVIIKLIVNNTKAKNLYSMIEDFLSKYKNVLFKLFYKLIADLGSRRKLTSLIRDFLLDNIDNNKTTLLEELKNKLNNETIMENLIEIIIDFEDEIANWSVKELLANNHFVNFVLNFIKNANFIRNITEIIINLNDKNYLKYAIPKFTETFLGNNEEYREILRNITKITLINLVKKEDFNKFVAGDLAKFFGKFLFDEDVQFLGEIERECQVFFKFIFFDELNEEVESLRYFYSKKLFIDTTKNKNDFLTYENCLNDKNRSFNIGGYIYQTIFLVGIISDSYSQSKLKDSILYKKYDYLQSFCLPYGIRIENGTEKPVCQKKDYNALIKVFNGLIHDMNTSTIDSFWLKKEDIQIENKDYFNFSINALILTFPLLINLFLIIYKKIFDKKHQKSVIINKLNLEKGKENSVLKTDTEITDELNLIIYPNWYRTLIKYFDIINNWKELFNFSSTKTEFNDFNGITYIKGILGLSIFLNIFGLTFFTLSNLPHKTTAIKHFYDTISSPFYCILYIGFKYAPRIIFSCSGYTLIYKYLFFLDQDSSNTWYQFLFFHSYRYILLIGVALFMRFSLCYLDIIFRSKKSTIFHLYNYILKNDDINYFLNLFTLLFYNMDKSKKDRIESMVQYLYLPINEVFLYMVGILLISLGYKYKFRMDIIIISIILFLFVIKIIIFVVFDHNQKIYTTLYFYLFDYGSIMLNPLFNLPSFLIGMYFGLNNFIIQRGITEPFFEIHYSKVELLESVKTPTTTMKKERNSVVISNDNLNISYQNDLSSEKSRILNNTFEVENKNLFNGKEDNLTLDKSLEIALEQNKAKDEYNNILPENKNMIREIRILKTAIDFTNFHRRNNEKVYFIIIMVVLGIIFCFFITLNYFYLYFYIGRYMNQKEQFDTSLLYFDKIIPNYFLNLVYLIDIEIVVFIVHWFCFFVYFKGSQLNDFLDNIYWSFFIKSYYSYALVSSPVILYIFYQSETVIIMSLSNIILYSSIGIILIFISVVVFYGFYEYPLKKLFKTFKLKRTIINKENEDLDYYDNNNDDNDKITND